MTIVMRTPEDIARDDVFLSHGDEKISIRSLIKILKKIDEGHLLRVVIEEFEDDLDVADKTTKDKISEDFGRAIERLD